MSLSSNYSGLAVCTRLRQALLRNEKRDHGLLEMLRGKALEVGSYLRRPMTGTLLYLLSSKHNIGIIFD